MGMDLIVVNFAPIIGGIFLIVFLSVNSELDKNIKKIFYLLILLQFIELIAFSRELILAYRLDFNEFRIFWSAVGYSSRPLLLYLILRLSIRNEPKAKQYKRFLIIMLVLNTIVAFSAFFTDVAYSYTSDNVFVRGPLGFFPHIVTALYQLFLLIFNIRACKGKRKFESLLLLIIIIFISLSMVVEGFSYKYNIGRSVISLSIIFYYMYFQSQFYRLNMNEEYILRKSLEMENRIDGLTGLLNKKSFENEVRKFLKSPYTKEVLFIFFDLDYFKDVNDYLGHAFGDQVLIEVGAKTKDIFRKDDLVARFGGDEFCIFISDIPLKNVKQLLEKLVELLRIDYSNEEKTVSISGSVGAVYCSASNFMDYSTLLKEADEALYEAKNSGRNRYILKEFISFRENEAE